MSGFVDEAQVHVKAGNGGAGATSFRREAHVAKGGPDGGDGGAGGDVYLEASRSLVSLLAFRDHPHRRAGDGTHGGGGRRHGRNGADLIVPVPQGTIVRDLDGVMLADLTAVGHRFLAAHGGRAGRGNSRFLSNRLRAPGFAEQGEVGEEFWLDLELKLIADVALVGFPNAGKSTFISAISAAKPKIADYPFTTLEPHLGVVRLGRDETQLTGTKHFAASRSARGSMVGGISGEQATSGVGAMTEFIVADIPGLVEGASEGRGLGHQFLRHVERARVLLVLADMASADERSPADQVRVLLVELERHNPALLERPRIVVGSRSDLIAPDDRGDLQSLGVESLISAATGEGIADLVGRMASVVATDRIDSGPVKALAPVVHRPVPECVEVVREGSAFVVLGREAVRAVAVSDLTDPDALAYVQRRLKRIGVDRALQRAGCRHGDAVRVGELSFTYEV